MTTVTARKPAILTAKIRETVSPNGLVTFITDTNKTRRQSAEILEVMHFGRKAFNVRIDRNGSVAGYLANICVDTALAAYEYACQFA